jgi:hypothetical protein
MENIKRIKQLLLDLEKNLDAIGELNSNIIPVLPETSLNFLEQKGLTVLSKGIGINYENSLNSVNRIKQEIETILEQG